MIRFIMVCKVIIEHNKLLSKAWGRCHIKKYFMFTKFPKDIKPFTLVMLLITAGQFYSCRTTVLEVLITDLQLAVLYLFVSLIIDWVRMSNDR